MVGGIGKGEEFMIALCRFQTARISLLNISEHSRLLFRTRFFQQKHFDIYQIV